MHTKEIAEFGRRMGLVDFKLANDNLAALDIKNIGRLYLELKEDKLLLYLAKEIAAHDDESLEKALKLCHFKHNNPYNLRAALYKEKLTLITSCDSNMVLATDMEKMTVFLMQKMKEIF